MTGQDAVEFLRGVGEWIGDNMVAVVAVVLATGWRLIWPRKSDRIRHTLDAPAGTVAHLDIGEPGKDAK